PLLCCFSAHRAHPPCPTRRSSDLQRQEPEPPALAQPAPESEDAGGRHEGKQTEFVHGSHRRGQCRALGETGDSGEEALTHRIRRDRKSTRLNSSHVSISYAVFCLK